MWGALLAASMAAWLHQLTTATRGETILDGHGVRGGKAMIATLRRRLIAVPARLVRHACAADPAAAARPRPARRGPRPPARPPRDALTTGPTAPPRNLEPANPGDTRASTRPAPETAPAKIRNNPEDQLRALLADSGQKMITATSGGRRQC